MDTVMLFQTRDIFRVGRGNVQPDEENRLLRHFIRADTIGRLKSTLRDRGEASIVRTLQLSRGSEAADLRDKVYAFLGVASQETRNAIVPDYSSANSVSDVYMELGSYCIRSTEAITLLHAA